MARPKKTHALCIVRKGAKAPKDYDIMVLDEFTSKAEAEKEYKKRHDAATDEERYHLCVLGLDGSKKPCLPPGELHSIK